MKEKIRIKIDSKDVRVRKEIAPPSKTFKSKKDWTRKPKYKADYFTED